MRAAPLPLGRDKEEVDRRRGGALYTHAHARTTACTRRRGHTPPSWPAPPDLSPLSPNPEGYQAILFKNYAEGHVCPNEPVSAYVHFHTMPYSGLVWLDLVSLPFRWASEDKIRAS